MTPLRIHGFEPVSAVNGPGLRAVVWVQGCTLGCPGCFNPGTHGRDGEEVTVDHLFERITGLGDRISGVTISGGEPLQQRDGVLALLGRIRAETTLTSILFTGYEWPAVRRMPGADLLRERVDVLVAGRYQRSQRLGRGLRGSANKRVLTFGDRVRADELDDVPDAEIVIRPDGVLSISGINPPTLLGDVR
ncbi:4Fe-4S single cluster domain-containing protein [Actinoplanes sp. NPDC051470]|uniref:4Fe-4S single cluster domain-containing protein n=1 Tax=Actinoplanes sp. NPDC051470 TaxID=3157224 RepID=UPI00342A3220